LSGEVKSGKMFTVYSNFRDCFFEKKEYNTRYADTMPLIDVNACTASRVNCGAAVCRRVSPAADVKITFPQIGFTD